MNVTQYVGVNLKAEPVLHWQPMELF